MTPLILPSTKGSSGADFFFFNDYKSGTRCWIYLSVNFTADTYIGWKSMRILHSFQSYQRFMVIRDKIFIDVTSLCIIILCLINPSLYNETYLTGSQSTICWFVVQHLRSVPMDRLKHHTPLMLPHYWPVFLYQHQSEHYQLKVDNNMARA